MSSGYQTKFDRENGIGSIIESLGDSGVTHIFVHDVISQNDQNQAAATVLGREKDSEKALVIARPDDLVCALYPIDSQYLEFLSALGIGPACGRVISATERGEENNSATLSESISNNSKVLAQIIKLLDKDKEVFINPYIASLGDFKLADAIGALLENKIHVLGGDLKIVTCALHKHKVREVAISLGVPVPDGAIVELKLGKDRRPRSLTPLLSAVNRHIRKTGKVIIKSSFGILRSSLSIVEDNSESIERCLKEIAVSSNHRVYLVEEMLDVMVSPNILMHIEPENGHIMCIGVTDQLLDENLAHQGNIYPSRAQTIKKMMAAAKKLSKWLQAGGYTGIVGFDFGEYFNPENREVDYFLSEINARTNASTYPKALMDNLNVKQGQEDKPSVEAFFASKHVKTNTRSFSEFKEKYEELLFKSETGKGMVPYNIGCLEDGKLSLVFMGKNPGEVLKIYEKAMHLYGIKDVDRKEICHFQIRSPTLQQATGNALAFAVQKRY